ncbi:possible Lysyl hydrolase [Prochlorococcus marinus str. MIT 9313]|uniref:Possible Lysyl hydrolase n=1 Tax=Prochlorococcus marinus (strain MIT 9313) TaxID=74547 RepID=Q7TV58_PROMM|nr:possible Lysyl hydrolase [Prochlorococcus marinus str. MIT 9313]
MGKSCDSDELVVLTRVVRFTGTSMKYIEDQYFQYRADQATQVLSKSRETIKAAKDHLYKAYTFLIEIYTPPSICCSGSFIQFNRCLNSSALD